MKFFLDSAVIDEIEEAYSTFGIDGVTANPCRIQASGKSFERAATDLALWARSRDLTDYLTFPIAVEIDPHLDTAVDMAAAARAVAGMCDNFVVKLPCTVAGLTAARALEREGVRTDLTLVFSTGQALAAARTGALFVSPFMGWKEATGEDSGDYIRQIVDVYRLHSYKTQIICTSIHSGRQVVEAATAGAHIVTAGLSIYQDLLSHPYTRDGLAAYREAWNGKEDGPGGTAPPASRRTVVARRSPGGRGKK